MTDLFESLVALFVATGLNGLVLWQLRQRHDAGQQAYLTRLYAAAVLLRSTLAILLNVLLPNSAIAASFWGDSGSYDGGGHQLAQKWAGEPIASAYLSTALSGYGWVHFVGTLYFVFGRNQLLVQLVNSVFGGLSILVIYAIARRLFGIEPARWAALFVAFFPQMVVWSIGMYKDPAILLCITLAMYAVLRLRERVEPSMVLLFAVAVLTLMTLRFYVAYFVVFATLATFAFTQRQGPLRMSLTYALLVGALVGALRLAVPRETLEQQRTYFTLERVQVTRQDQAMWGQSGFGQEHDVSTPEGAIAALPTGLVYLLFAPFPWAASGLRQTLAIPETLVWYALMPAFVRGLLYSVRTRFAAVLPILVFAGSLTVAYALMQGNVGTAYRQRTQVTMFFFVFIGVGIARRRARRATSRAADAGVSGP